MKDIVKQWIALLLTICFFALLIPLDIVHDHHEPDHCDIENVLIESNPCHISTFHSQENKKSKCDHEKHFTKESKACGICFFLKSPRNQFAKFETVAYVFVPREIDLKFSSIITVAQSVSDDEHGRAPPF